MTTVMEHHEQLAQELIAKFMAASSPLEAYLQQKGPMTDVQLESLSVTLESLQTFLQIWKQKHGKPSLDLFGRDKA